MVDPAGGGNPFGGLLGPQGGQGPQNPPGGGMKTGGHDGLKRYFIDKLHWTEADYKKFKKTLEQFLAARFKQAEQKQDEAIKKAGQKIKSGD